MCRRNNVLANKKDKAVKSEKIIILILILIFGIVGVSSIYCIHIYKRNIFEEIYYAELKRAENQENSVLSGTKYFETSEAKKEGSYGEKEFYVRELPATDSPYTLQVSYYTEGSGFHHFKTKSVILGVKYKYKEVDFSVQYRYLFDGGNADPAVSGEGLHILWSAKKNGEHLTSSSEAYKRKILQKLDITEPEIDAVNEEELEKFLKIWVNAYPDSKFKNKIQKGEYYNEKK